jgi:Uma2 family endonuclease
MGEPAGKVSFTYAEYLERELASDTRHQFLDGQIYDMSGGSPDHALIAANVSGELRSQLRDRPCRVFSSDLRIRVQETGLSTYPDVSVVCGKTQVDAEDPHAILNPIVLVEVLSPTTESFDRGKKFNHYRRIPSLREYVLVAHDARSVEVFRRGEDGAWTLYEAQAGGSVELTSIGCKLDVDEVYRGASDEEGTT